MDDLVALIRRRLEAKTSDLGNRSDLPLRPGDARGIADDEKQFGFTLPPPLKRLYTEIGNGGFGPGYGLIGLTGGVPDDTGKSAISLYASFRESDPSEPGWNWPAGLLPLCHWGCAILSCVDCADPDFRMRIFDPNVHDGQDWSDSFFDEADGFEPWIGAWASGVDLWDRMYAETGRIARILSARRHGR